MSKTTRVDKVEEINKRSLAKLIIKYCGNEGNMTEERNTSLRKLLQEIIRFLDTENNWRWKNAEINVYDNEYNSFTIISGNGDNKYIVQFKGQTENVEIINIKRPYSCVLL